MSDDYYLVEEGRSTGPHSLAVLRQKAEVFALRPESLVFPVAPAADGVAGEWKPIHALPELHALLFPARARFSLGEARISENVSRSDAELAPTHVAEMLRANTTRQVEAEGPLLRPPVTPYRYRRMRDYAWSAGGLNAFCIVYGASSTFLNPFLIALFVIGNLSLLWVLFVIMDRY